MEEKTEKKEVGKILATSAEANPGRVKHVGPSFAWGCPKSRRRTTKLAGWVWVRATPPRRAAFETIELNVPRHYTVCK